MNLSAPFVRRPIGTVLLTVGVALAGIAGFFVLPVSPLPQVEYPVISVSANIPGASPETMATSVATPPGWPCDRSGCFAAWTAGRRGSR